MKLTPTVTEIVVDYGSCNDRAITSLDFSQCQRLERIEIGSSCLAYVRELKLVGMPELLSVVIGAVSFKGSNGNFSLTNCPKLKELRFGRFTFSEYRTCVIKDTPSVEVIEIGNLDPKQYCHSFYSASLELKSAQ